MVRIELVDWQNARAKATPVRFTVFVEEQRVPAALEMDAMDERCVHALAFEGDEVVGTGRLLSDGHVGRMAVLREWRGRGIGGLILEALVEAARKRGDRAVVLAAQVHAVPFYVAHGFAMEGSVYQEAGIPHQDMRRPL